MKTAIVTLGENMQNHKLSDSKKELFCRLYPQISVQPLWSDGHLKTCRLFMYWF